MIRNNCFYILASLLLLQMAACKKPDFQGDQLVKANLRTAGDYIQNNYAFSLFAYAVQRAGLMDSLNNPGLSYTLLAPDDVAFNTDSIFTPADLDKWGADSLRFFVKNHILRGKVFYSDVPTNLDNLFTNLNGLTLYFSISQIAYLNNLYINGVLVKQQDIALINGVIQVLTYPLKISSGKVQDFLASRPDLQDLVAGLKKYNLWDGLDKAGELTVFAPRDTSFNVAGLSVAAIGQLDTARYKSILFGGYVLPAHHLFVSDGSLLVGAKLPLPGGYLFNMIGGCQVLDSSTRMVLGPLSPRLQPALNDYQRYTPYLDGNHIDYLFANGIVHMISDVLVLPADVPR